MTKEHATGEVIARGNIVHMNPSESQKNPAPQIINLRLDVDGKYRWYEEGQVTKAEGASLRTAISAARLQWPHFQVVEVRGRVLEPNEEIEDTYAADEIEQQGLRSR